MNKDHILAFIKSNIHAVISTCGNNHQPEAALIGFGETEAFELIFGTYKTSRKYQNLLENNRVAFVIGWEGDNITLQYEGVAQELTPEEVDHYVALYHQKVPSAAAYHNHPAQTYFKVRPTWLRYSDLSGDEEQITELTFS